MGLCREVPHRDRRVRVPADRAWSVPALRNPRTSDELFTEAEIAAFIKRGIAKHALVDSKPVGFSEESVPPAGRDVRLWRLRQVGGGVYLMTVPPFLARSAEEALVPREVLGKP